MEEALALPVVESWEEDELGSWGCEAALPTFFGGKDSTKIANRPL